MGDETLSTEKLMGGEGDGDGNEERFFHLRRAGMEAEEKRGIPSESETQNSEDIFLREWIKSLNQRNSGNSSDWETSNHSPKLVRWLASLLHTQLILIGFDCWVRPQKRILF